VIGSVAVKAKGRDRRKMLKMGDAIRYEASRSCWNDVGRKSVTEK